MRRIDHARQGGAGLTVIHAFENATDQAVDYIDTAAPILSRYRFRR
jgi:hypothetical protein